MAWKNRPLFYRGSDYSLNYSGGLSGAANTALRWNSIAAQVSRSFKIT